MQGTIKLLCQIGQDRAIAEQHVKIVSKQMEKIQALQKVCQSITWVSCGFHMGIVWVSHGYHVAITCNVRGFVSYDRAIAEQHVKIVSKQMEMISCGFHMGIMWASCGYHM